MYIISEHTDFVKEQIAHYDRMALKSRSNKERAELYATVATKLRMLLSFLESLPSNSGQVEVTDADNVASALLSSIPLSKLPPGFLNNPLSISPADLSGLPEDVIKELNITPSDRLEVTIMELVAAAGGTLILDKLIAGLYHLTDEVHQRNTLTAKLYRMSKKEMLFSVPRKKGMYTIHKPSEPEETSEPDDLPPLA